MAEKDKATEATVRNIRLKTHKKNSPEEKIWIVLYGLWGEKKITELYRQERINQAVKTHAKFNFYPCIIILCKGWKDSLSKMKVLSQRLQ